VVAVQYNNHESAFDITYSFCTLRFYLTEYMKKYSISNIKLMSQDVFKYSHGGVEEYESISRRVLGESEVSVIPYTVTHEGYRLLQYNVDIITTLMPDIVIKKICESCERGDAVWELKKVLN